MSSGALNWGYPGLPKRSKLSKSSSDLCRRYFDRLSGACVRPGWADGSRALCARRIAVTAQTGIRTNQTVCRRVRGPGELDRAFEWLEKAFQDRDPILFWMRSVPFFEPLRSDPRFEEMARRIGLPQR